MKRKSKNLSKEPSPFCFTVKGNLLSVWYGPPEDLESDFVFDIDKSLIPDLIHILRKAQYT